MPETTPGALRIQIDDGCLQLDGWRSCSPEVVRFVEQRLAAGEPVEAVGASLDRVLRMGVLAMDAAGVTINVDELDREFERMRGELTTQFDARVAQLEATFEGVFDEGDGTLARALERFVGEGGALPALFDPERRDSAIGRIRGLLDEHVRGQATSLHGLLDLTNEASPLATWRAEMQREFDRQRTTIEEYRRELAEAVGAQVAAVEERARAEVERARAEFEAAEELAAEHDRGTAKGREYEDLAFEVVNDIARVFGDTVEVTGDVQGMGGCKQGDLVVHLSPRDTGGLALRLALEVKDRQVGLTPILRELDGAKDNRGAAGALAVFARADQMPSGAAPFREQGHGRYLVLLDKQAPDERTALEVAYRLARFQAIADLHTDDAEVDTRAIRDDLEATRHRLQAFSAVKGSLTRLRSGVTGGIDDLERQVEALRSDLLACVERLETRIHAGDEDPAFHVA
ncbi:MAG TPA: hypothetical protein VGA36_05255 [Nitriliruptorales bacterium]